MMCLPDVWRSRRPAGRSHHACAGLRQPKRTRQGYGELDATSTTDTLAPRTVPSRSLAARDDRHHACEASASRSARSMRSPGRPRRRSGRDRHPARAQRVRQDHAAADHRRAGDAIDGSVTIDGRRQRPRAPRSGSVSCRSRRRCSRGERSRPTCACCKTSTGRQPAPPARSGRPAGRRRARRLRRRLPARAVGRDAAARRARPGVRARRAVPADGRAVRRP